MEFYCAQARRRERDRIRILATQTARLNRLLAAAAKTSYYGIQFAAAGLGMELRSAQELERYPFLTRDDLAEDWMQLVPPDADLGGCSREATSGTTGKPISVVWPSDIGPRLEARIKTRLRRLGIALPGIRPFATVWLYVSDTEYVPERRRVRTLLPGLMFGIAGKIDFRPINDEEPWMPLQAIIDAAPVALTGKPSSLRSLAAAIATHRAVLKGELRPRVVFTGAEHLTATARQQLEQAFQCKVYDTYGLTECPAVGCECRERRGFHYEDDEVIVEVVDGDRRVAPRETGEIVVTNLNNLVQPLIRYRTGDIGSVDYEPCECGLAYPRIRLIEGRKLDFFLSLEGAEVNPFPMIESLPGLGLKQYQLVQRADGSVLVRFVGDLPAAQVLQAVTGPARKLLGETVPIDAERVAAIDLPGQKTRLYVREAA